jgi:hypothetical protein
MNGAKFLKILCTGNPSHNTVARSIKKYFPTADFASRHSGYDLRMWDTESENFFKNKIVNYDILINSSFISLGAQLKILNLTAEIWKFGHVINIGSTSEFNGRDSEFGMYSVDKKSLRERSLQLNNKNFKTTHIIAGGLNDGDPEHKDWLDIDHIAKTIKWILEQPFSVPIIGIEK